MSIYIESNLTAILSLDIYDPRLVRPVNPHSHKENLYGIDPAHNTEDYTYSQQRRR